MREILRYTYSVCPVCLKRIPAVHVAYDNEVHLEKACPQHGNFSTIIWRGLRDMDAWRGDIPRLRKERMKAVRMHAACVPNTNRAPAVFCWRLLNAATCVVLSALPRVGQAKIYLLKRLRPV
jgi:hypothetical protein